MAGIFGYLCQEVDENKLNDVVTIIREADYCIANSVLNRSCILGTLDIRSAEPTKALTKTEAPVSIVTCGRVYNEGVNNLSQSILEFYREKRLDKVEALNGSFAAAIYDASNETLTVVNDRHGLIKLFYYHDKECFCFAPKIRPLLRWGSKKSLRKDAIIDFFLFGIC